MQPNSDVSFLVERKASDVSLEIRFKIHTIKLHVTQPLQSRMQTKNFTHINRN